MEYACSMVVAVVSSIAKMWCLTSRDSMVAFFDGRLPVGSLVFHHQFLDLFVSIVERFVDGI